MRKFFYFLISSALMLSLLVEYHLVAYAAPTPPPYTTSRYMKTVNITTLYNMGCALGTHDKNTPGTQDNVVILDFGRPWVQDSTYGTLMWTIVGGYLFVTTAQIANAVKQFGKGYWECTGSDTTSQLFLAIGTSNYGEYVNSGHGKAWAQRVNSVNSWLSQYGYASQVKARGAIDIELEWNSPSVTRTWVDGYTSVWQYIFYNFGNASGCPSPAYPNYDCGTPEHPEWTSEDVWYVSWGAAPAYPLPEIYRTDGENAGQWYYLSLYSYTNHPSRMDLKGAVTQYQACQQRGGCAGINNTPSQGWSQLWDALNADTRTAQSLRWSTDMKWVGE